MKPAAGTTSWFDLPARDLPDARAFYEGLFNWTFLRFSDDRLPGYWMIQSGDRLIGGLRLCGDPPAGDGVAVPVLYVTVNDLAAAGARVRELGGTLVGERVDLGKGRGSYQWFRDRQDNLLALWAAEDTHHDVH